MPVLAEKTVKSAGLIEYGQVLIAIFRAVSQGEFGEAAASASRADPVGNAVSGKRVKIPGYVRPFRPATFEFILAILPYPTITPFAGAYPAGIDADRARNSFWIFGWRKRQIKFLASLLMHGLNMSFDLSKSISDAGEANAECAGDERRVLAAGDAANR